MRPSTTSGVGNDLTRLITAFHDAHPDSLHDERTIAAVIGCSEEKLQRDRWAGKGLPYVRFGRLVRYRKSDVVGLPAVSAISGQNHDDRAPESVRIASMPEAA